jgi:hypothetical protein
MELESNTACMNEAISELDLSITSKSPTSVTQSLISPPIIKHQSSSRINSLIDSLNLSNNEKSNKLSVADISGNATGGKVKDRRKVNKTKLNTSCDLTVNGGAQTTKLNHNNSVSNNNTSTANGLMNDDHDHDDQVLINLTSSNCKNGVKSQISKKLNNDGMSDKYEKENDGDEEGEEQVEKEDETAKLVSLLGDQEPDEHEQNDDDDGDDDLEIKSSNRSLNEDDGDEEEQKILKELQNDEAFSESDGKSN